MKIFHTADWHLGKIVQGVHMTEDQAYVLDQLLEAIAKEKPDAIIIAGDLYDRAVPPAEAVHLLDRMLKRLILDLNIPVLVIAGNHDSPSRLDFASQILKDNGLHIIGKFSLDRKPVILQDAFGPVYFHLVPFTDPSTVRHVFDDDSIRTHDDAMQKIIHHIMMHHWDESARHIFVGHAFVTPYGEAAEKTSDSEMTLAIGGAEFVNANHFKPFHYTALGHLHRAHSVLQENIHYAGSILKYSISEANHQKGFTIVHLDEKGHVTLEKRQLIPRRDMRRVEAYLDELLQHQKNEDYVFVRLLDEMPVLYPMERIRSVYPNALHVERKYSFIQHQADRPHQIDRSKMNDQQLFKLFYETVSKKSLSKEAEGIFEEVLDELMKSERD